MPSTSPLSTKRLQQEKEKFEALFQYASMGILVAGKAGEILMANNFLLSQFGYSSQEELIGKKIRTTHPSRYHGRSAQIPG